MRHGVVIITKWFSSPDMKRFITYIFLLLVVTSCDKWRSDDPFAEYELVSFASTKGAGDGKIYRVYLNGLENYSTRGTETSGVYQDSDASGPLAPYPNSDNGLRAPNGTYRMHIVYPNVEMTPIPSNFGGNGSMNGYLLNRIQGTDPKIYLSEEVDVVLSGVYLSLVGGSSQYIFDANGFPLKERRSKITINAKKGEGIAPTTLHSVSFKNVIQSGYYRPLDRRLYFVPIAPDSQDSKIEILNGELSLGESYSQIGQTTTILSMNYGETDEQSNYKWPLPTFVLSAEIGGKSETFTVALGWDFKPQTEYVFDITIRSVEVRIDVTAKAWDDKNVSSSPVGEQPSWTVTFPLEGNGNNFSWDNRGTIEGTIE